jgi:hypothetical protein
MSDNKHLSNRPSSNGLKLLVIVEVKGVGDEAVAQAVLDAYREIAASASIVDDVTLYRATCEDVRESGMLDQVKQTGPVPSAFVEPWPYTSEA